MYKSTDVDKGKDQPLTAVLLPMLTNLFSISFVAYDSRSKELAEMLKILAEPINANLLSSLVTVYIRAGDHQSFVHFEWFCRFAALPSV